MKLIHTTTILLLLLSLCLLACDPCKNVDCLSPNYFADALPFRIVGELEGGYSIAEVEDAFLVKTVKNQPTMGLDTVKLDAIDNTGAVFHIGPTTFFQDSNWTDYDYLVENLFPAFKVRVSGIEVEGTLTQGSCCEFYQNTDKRFWLNGEEKDRSDLPILITK